MTRRFQMIDVFGSGPVSGNPLAVVHEAEDLDTEEMQAITRWLNLSETTFLLPPTTTEADYRVRIFTLAGELPFAGHPTLGSCHAWLSTGATSKQNDVVIQECDAGLISLRKGDHLAFAAPPLLREGSVDDGYIAQVAAVLGIDGSEIVDVAWVDNGPGWVGVLLEDAEAVLTLEPDLSRYEGEGKVDIGVLGPHADGEELAYEVRGFFLDDRGVLIEDPVTGSLNASLAQWMLQTGRVTAPYVAAQGTAIGRRGRIHITQDSDGTIWVGGSTVTLVNGEIS
jgi:PhzF family phenazine biosynthesis protein